MTDETSRGKRGIFLPIFILLLVAYIFLKIFSINVSFWILLIAVIVIVAIKKIPALSSLTGKFPSWKKAAGWLVALLIVGAILYYPALFGWIVYLNTQEKMPVVSDASVDQGMGNWIGAGGAKTGGDYFKLSPKSSLTQKFEGTIASIALFNLELADDEADETQLEISIIDQYDYEGNLLTTYRRSAKTSFTIKREEVISSGEIKFGNSMKKLNLAPGKSEALSNQQGNFASLTVDKKHVACGYGTAGNFSSLAWEICPEGYQDRGIKRPYLVTIKNLGDEKILIDEIRVIKN